MDYPISIEVAGTTVEFDYDICDDYIFDYVTNNSCPEWAKEHFEEYGAVDEFVESYLADMETTALLELVAPLLEIEVNG
jgi:hypothetical protein